MVEAQYRWHVGSFVLRCYAEPNPSYVRNDACVSDLRCFQTYPELVVGAWIP